MVTTSKVRPRYHYKRPIKVKDMPKQGKVVLLFSGGLDSTNLLCKLLFDGFDPYPLTVSYGQRHEKEVFAARNICEHLHILGNWKYLNLGNLGGILKSSLTGSGEIPDGHYEEESMKSTVVPNRNMILLALAAGYGESIEAKFLAYGAHAGDHAIYPDCRPEFYKSCAETIKLSTGLEILAPFIGLKKDEILSKSKYWKVPYWLTWSCYKGGEYHCGTCGTCVERKEAFEESGIPDPTIYRTEPYPNAYTPKT